MTLREMQNLLLVTSSQRDTDSFSEDDLAKQQAIGSFNRATGNDGSFVDSAQNMLGSAVIEAAKVPTAALDIGRYLAGENKSFEGLNALNKTQAEWLGMDESGQVRQNDLGTVAGSALGFGMAKAGIEGSLTLTKQMANKAAASVSETFAEKQVAKNILTSAENKFTVKGELLNTAKASSLAPISDTNVNLDDDLNFKHNTDTLTNPNKFMQSMATDAMMGAPFDVAITGVGEGIIGNRSRTKNMAKFKESEFSKFADSETESSVVTVLNAGHAKNMENIVSNPNGSKSGNIGTMQVTLGEDGLIYISSEDFAQMKENTTSKDTGAFVDQSTGEVLLNGKGIGSLKGKLDSNGDIIFNNADSKATDQLLNFKRNGRKVLEYANDAERGGMRDLFLSKEELSAKSQAGDEMHYTQLVSSDAEGNIHTKDNIQLSNEKLAEAESIKSVLGKTGGTDTQGRSIHQEILMRDLSKLTDEDIGALPKPIQAVVNAVRSNKVSLDAIASNLVDNIDAFDSKANPEIAKLVDQFKKGYVNNDGDVKNINAKSELKNAIVNSLAMKIANMDLTAVKVDGKVRYKIELTKMPKDFSTQVLREAMFDIMDIDPKGVMHPDELIKKIIGDKTDTNLEAMLFDSFLKREDVTGKAIDEEGRLDTSKIEDTKYLKEEFNVIVESILKQASQDIDSDGRIQRAANSVTKEAKALFKRKNNGININGKEGRINGIPQGLHENVYVSMNKKAFAEAKFLASVKRKFDIPKVERIREALIANRANLLDIIKDTNDKVVHDFVKNAMTDDIESIYKVMDTIQEIIDNGNEFTLDTNIESGSNRVSYVGDINPHNSKLFRYLQAMATNQDFNLTLKEDLDVITNHINDVLFGKSLTDGEPKFYLEFNSVEDLIAARSKIESATKKSLEGFIVKEFALKLIDDLVAGKDPTKVAYTAAIDSKNNNYTIMHVMLGKTNDSLRLFSKDGVPANFDISNDSSMPNKILDAIKQTFGDEAGAAIASMGRQSGKDIFTPFVYMATPTGTTSNFALSVLMHALKIDQKDRFNSLPTTIINEYNKMVLILENSLKAENETGKALKIAYDAYKAAKDKPTNSSNYSSELKAAKEAFNNAYEKVDSTNKAPLDLIDAHDALFGTNRVDSNTEAHIEAFAKFIGEDTSINRFIKSVRDNIIDKKVMSFIEDLELSLTAAKAKFIHERQNNEIYKFSKEEAYKIIEQAYRDKGVKFVESRFNDSFNLEGKYSIDYIIEQLASVNMLSTKSIFDYNIVASKFQSLAVRNPFNGDFMSLAMFQGNQTFLGGKGIVVKGLNSASIMTPMFIQSIESSISSRAYSGKGENVFDATYGGKEIVESAHIANSLLAQLFENDVSGNGYHIIRDIMTGIDSQSMGNVFSNEILYKMVNDQNIKNDNVGEVDSAKVTELGNKLRKFVNEKIIITDSDQSIRILANEVSANKQKNDGVIVGNYGVSKSLFTSDSQSITSETFTDLNNRSKSAATSPTNHGLGFIAIDRKKNVFKRLLDSSTRVIERFVNFEFVTDGQKSSYSKSKNTITLAFKDGDFSESNLRQLVHEIVHAASEGDMSRIDGHDKMMQMFSDWFDTVQPDTLEGSFHKEKFTAIVEAILVNEMLKKNKAEFANKFNSNDLSSMYTIIEGVHSIGDLRNMINERLESDEKIEVMQAFEDVIDSTQQLLNSREVLDYLNGLKKADPMKIDTVLDTNNDVPFKERIDKALGFVQQITKDTTLLEMLGFDLTREREAMNRVIGLKGGMEDAIQKVTAALMDDIKKLDSTIGNPVEVKKLKTNVGAAVSMGLNMFVDEMKLKDGKAKISNIDSAVTYMLDFIGRELDLTDSGNIRGMIQKLVESKGYTNADEIKSIVNSEVEKLKGRLESLALGNHAKGFTLDKTVYGFMKELQNNNIINKSEGINIDNIRNRFEKIIAAQRILHFAQQRGADGKGTPALQRFFKNLADPSKREYAIATLNLFNIHRSTDNLFGANFEINLTKTDKMVKVVNASERSKYKEKEILGEARDDHGNAYIFLASNNEKYVVGGQDSHIVDYDITDNGYKSGVLTYKKKGLSVILKPSQINTAHSAVDIDIDTQIRRNAYLELHKKMSYEVLNKQYSLMKSNGLILDGSTLRSEIESGRTMENWEELGSDHPIAKMAGGKVFYNKAHLDLIIGTKGFDIRQLTKNLGSMNDIAFNTLKVMLDVTKGLKSTILLGRVGGYINNIVANGLQYAIHAKNPLSMKEDYTWASAESKVFRKLSEEYAIAYKDQDTIKMEESEARMKAHPLYEAFANNIFSTIRSDAYKTGSYTELSVIGSLNRLDKSGTTGNIAKNIFMDPSTKIGQYLGNMFDQTEIIPKLALWKNLGDMPTAQKVQYIQFAFPTYQNLPFLANAIDQVFPYTKYMMNYPKMLLFTMNKAFYRNAMANAALPMMAMASWKMDDNEEKDKLFKENGAIYTGFGTYINASNWLMTSVVNPPSKSIDGSLFGAPLIYGATKSIFGDPMRFVLPFKSTNSSSTTKKETSAKADAPKKKEPSPSSSS